MPVDRTEPRACLFSPLYAIPRIRGFPDSENRFTPDLQEVLVSLQFHWALCDLSFGPPWFFPVEYRVKEFVGKNQGDFVILKTTRGNASSYLAARIRRDHPEIVKRIEAGEFKSMRRAAIAAGVIRIPTKLELIKRYWKKLSEQERQEFLVWIGSKLDPVSSVRTQSKHPQPSIPL